MHRTLIVVFSFFLTLYGFSQQFQITGKVVDNENNPVAFATVVLLKAADSSMVKGASADKNGGFKILNVAKGLYIAKASYVGSISDLRAIDISKDTDLGVLIINNATQQLDEVVVAAKRPTLERKPDRLVFNVENTVVSQGTAWDILKSTPGIIVNQNNISIKNQAATIYLNGRKVQLSSQELQDLLTGLSGTAIKSVEVFTSSSAKYDAEDGSILNIVTNKAVTPGYKGSLNLNYTQAVFPKYNFGVSNYFKTEKLNVFLNYTFNPKNEIKKTIKGINFINGFDQTYAIWDTDDERIEKSKAHQGTLIMDYDIDDDNSLNFTSNISVNPNKEIDRRSNTEMFNGNKVLDSTLVNQNQFVSDYTNLAFDLSYVRKLNDKGSELRFNSHLTDYDYEYSQDLNSDYLDSNNNIFREFSFDSDSKQTIQITTTQLDVLIPSEKLSFEGGLKYSHIDSESKVGFLNLIGTNPNVNEDLSDNFNYQEQVFASYVSFLKNWEKWSVNFGLRGEYTDAKGVSITLGVANQQTFFKLFPSLNIFHTFCEKFSVAFDYGKNVERPRYDDLNPFRNFINENDFTDGNPSLAPYFGDEYKLNFNYNDEFFVDFYYQDNEGYIDDLVFQDNESRALKVLKQNVLDNKAYGIDVTWVKNIVNPWNLYAYLSVFHDEQTFIAEESGNVPYTNEANGVYVYLGNYLTLSKNGSLTAETTFTYSPNFIYGSYILEEQINLTFGLKKSFLKDRAVLSIVIEDILERNAYEYTSRYLNQDNFYRFRPETQFIRFGFTYNFGNFRLSDNKRNINKKERDRLKD